MTSGPDERGAVHWYEDDGLWVGFADVMFPSRRSDASQARTMLRADRNVSLGQSLIEP